MEAREESEHHHNKTHSEVGFASVARSCSTLLRTVNAVSVDFQDLSLDKYAAYDAQR
jgi:hypothetical protein